MSRISFSLMLLMLILWAVLYLGRSLWSLQQPVLVTPGQRFQIHTGESFKNVALRMSKEGLIEDPRWLALYARFSGKAGKIKAGLFEIPQGSTQIEALNYFIGGDVIQDSIQFIEGTRYTDVLARLKNHPELKYDLPEKEEQLMPFLGLSGHPEGRFFPDTYQFDSGSNASDILKRAHTKLQRLLTQYWEAKAPSLPLRSSYEALILASLIEKETAVPAERPLIAGVFINRLRKNMRLETDPSVIYGLGDAYQGNLTRKHLRSWTAYNTYRINGLPPTPIALVGEAGIKAATQPQQTDALYFVAKGDGAHYFSKTYKEHRKAVAKYQIYERKKQYRTQPE